jgi:site-specific DNA-methyltransferase (adenine-specific)
VEDETTLMIIENQQVFFKSSEYMDDLDDGVVDVIVTSPPYNRKKHYSSDSGESYDDDLPEPEYLEFLRRVWKECLRVASSKVVFFLNIGDSAGDQGISEKVVSSAVESGWHRVQDIAWIKSIYGKGHYTPTGSNKRFNNVWEHVYMLVKDPESYEIDPKAIGIQYADRSNVGRYGDDDERDPGNAWHVCYETTTGVTVKKEHDAPFPIGLPYTCIKTVPDARAVLDPFLGTGTTLAASFKLGIAGFGYEKYPRKELIESTILAGLDYNPRSPVLIPHLEDSVAILASFLGRTNLKINAPRTKMMRERLQNLKDVLVKLEIDTDLIGEIENAIRTFDSEYRTDDVDLLPGKKRVWTIDEL